MRGTKANFAIIIFIPGYVNGNAFPYIIDGNKVNNNVYAYKGLYT